jgi:hypothetical protein
LGTSIRCPGLGVFPALAYGELRLAITPSCGARHLKPLRMLNYISKAMTAESRFQYAEQGVVHESFDDETVIVNLNNGAYYSLNAAGRAVWLMLGARMSISEIAAAAGAAAQGREQVEQFVLSLSSEGLIRAAEGEPQGPPTAPGFRREDGPPTMEKFTDMERLILLDVIHDVDATGWPILAAHDDPPKR